MIDFEVRSSPDGLSVHSLIPWPKPMAKTRPRALKLREQGFSHTEIARQIGVAKSTVVAICKESSSGLESKSTTKGNAPFGYIYFKGKLLFETREMIVVHNILQLHRDGHGDSSIVKILNDKKIAPRTAKQWDHSSVRKIIERYKDDFNLIEGYLERFAYEIGVQA